MSASIWLACTGADDCHFSLSQRRPMWSRSFASWESMMARSSSLGMRHGES